MSSYLTAAKAEHDALLAYVKALEAVGRHGMNYALALIVRHKVTLHGWPARHGEDNATGTQRSNHVARLFRNALTIHNMEVVANTVAVLESKKEKR